MLAQVLPQHTVPFHIVSDALAATHALSTLAKWQVDSASIARSLRAQLGAVMSGRFGIAKAFRQVPLSHVTSPFTHVTV